MYIYRGLPVKHMSMDYGVVPEKKQICKTTNVNTVVSNSVL